MTFPTYEDEERAAIHEFDGKCTRARAEFLTMNLRNFSVQWCNGQAKSLLAQASQAKDPTVKQSLTVQAAEMIAYAKGMEAHE